MLTMDQLEKVKPNLTLDKDDDRRVDIVEQTEQS